MSYSVRMTAPDPLDPLAPVPGGGTGDAPRDGTGAGSGADDGSPAAGRRRRRRRSGLRDRHARGLRHPRPFGARSERGRSEALLTAVEKAVERLGDLEAPGLARVTVRVERIPDRLEERLRLLHAGAEQDEESLFARAEREGPDGVLLTLFERPLMESADPGDLDGAVYGVALSRCAQALGVDPQVLDPSWGRA